MLLHGSRAKVQASLLAWAVLLVLGLSAVFFDAFPYDILAYHGPFSALATGIPRLRNYGMSVFMEHRFHGFPPCGDGSSRQAWPWIFPDSWLSPICWPSGSWCGPPGTPCGFPGR